MRVIFSRKGFDSVAGKAPSPIIEGEPISLPIPTKRRSETSYRLAGVGKIVEHVTNGRIGADDLCHEDPVFFNGRWAFGQTGAAQSHLERNGVGVGDVFLFFGLFASRDGRDRHHRISGAGGGWMSAASERARTVAMEAIGEKSSRWATVLFSSVPFEDAGF
jgi:hypothetical protein